jgi:hypothetical protein
MRDKTYLIRFKRSDLIPHLVVASSAEIHGEHLVFLHADGSLAALAVMDIVESWSEFKLKGAKALTLAVEIGLDIPANFPPKFIPRIE